MLKTYFKTMPSLSDQTSMNIQRVAYPAELDTIMSGDLFADAQREITSWPNYAATPLRELDELAKELELSAVYYKDESGRFELGSFKALGGAYAVIRLLADQLSDTLKIEVSPEDIRNGVYAEAAAEYTVVTATDGNHGRSVAWGARQANCRCRIYIHAGVSKGREQVMTDLGAEVIRIEGDYDASVQECARQAAENSWYVVSDTSYLGYDEVPRLVMAGYTVMASEILEQCTEKLPTHVFVQAGVGGLAAAICARLWMTMGADRPRFIIVEADRAPCLLASARAGVPKAVEIKEETIMAGLSCGEVSLLAWAVLERAGDHFVTVSDDRVGDAMRYLASGDFEGGKIEAGECSVTGLLALIATASSEQLRQQFGLDRNSRVLLFGTEGATDPVIYQSILKDG
jgi:diaminopropionate ammonia-lyase